MRIRMRVKRKDEVDLTNLFLLAEVAADIEKYENNIDYPLRNGNSNSSSNNKEEENHHDRDESHVMKKEESRGRHESRIKKHDEMSERDESQIKRDESQMMKRKQETVDYHTPCKKLRPPRSSPRHDGWRWAHFRLGGTPTIWICDKLLTASDTKHDQNRLLFSKASINNALLPHLNEDQKLRLRGLKENSNDNDGITVLALDEMGRQYQNMKLKQWVTGSYALKGEWTKIVEQNQLVAKHDALRICAFWYGTDNQHVGLVVTRNSQLVGA